MQSKATTVQQYLAELPVDRRKALEVLRKVFLDNLDKDFEEGMSYGMIGYVVPHRVFPDGYHCDPKQPLPFAGIASQKNHLSLYLMCVYGHEGQNKAFVEAWKKTGKKLDMGKACVRFKKIEDLALDVIAKTIREMPVKKYVEIYKKSLVSMEKAREARAAGRASSKKITPKKAAAKKPSAGKK